MTNEEVYMKVSVIIPMYNENKIIADTAKTLSDFMEKSFFDYEIVFVDDGSRDGSADTVRGLSLKNVKVLGYGENRGKGCAVRHGMLESDGDVRIFTDADLAYGTDVICRAVDAFKSSGADIIIGSRNIDKDGYDGYTLKRKLMSKAYIRLLCFVGGFKLSDSQCGFNVFSRQAAEMVFSKCSVDSFAFDFEAIIRAQRYGFKISEIPVRIVNHRESSVRPVRDALKMLGDLRRIKKAIRTEKDHN